MFLFLFDFGNRNDLVIVYVLFCREPRGGRSALFDGIEEGGIRASSYASHEINEHENERALEGLQDRVILLKRVSLSHFFRYILDKAPYSCSIETLS